MLGNSSSSNDSNLPPHNSSAPEDQSCFFSEPNSFIFTTFAITRIILLLPLCIFILHHGLQRWRQKSSTSSVSHSDIFTYHVVVMELVGGFGCLLIPCGVYRKNTIQFSVGFNLFLITWYGEMFFHVLTCVERYLAVVHPVTYLSLRNQGWVRIRNISITCVWLLCVVLSALSYMDHFIFVNFCLVILTLTVTSFCSLSVLRVLIRPGPGEQGEGRESVDQSKLRAFYTIMTVLGVLALRFVFDLATITEDILGSCRGCVSILREFWLNLPSGLVLPLLFLYKERKCICCNKNIQRGQDL